VQDLRRNLSSQRGIVARIDESVATETADDNTDEHFVEADDILRLRKMKKSLNSLGWEKQICNFGSWLPMAHLTIVANERLPEFMRSLMGVNEGQEVMDHVAEHIIFSEHDSSS
jgi:hypothetical protein